MKYSLVLPVYNVADYLERCLESILVQSHTDYEVILVNDGSTDKSAQICDDYANRYEQIKVFHQVNQGVAFARNFGFSQATGDYIWFIDPDDYLLGQPLAEVTEVLEQKPVDVLMFNYRDKNESKGKETLKQSPVVGTLMRQEFHQEFPQLFMTNMLYTVWNKLYKRTFLETKDLRFQALPFGEDTRFNLEVYQTLETIALVSGVYYTYIVERFQSAVTQYRPNRVAYQLEEYRLLGDFLNQNGIPSQELLKQVGSKLLVANCSNIMKSSLSFAEKKEQLQTLVGQPELRDVFQENPFLKPVMIKTLGRGHITLYMILKTVTLAIGR